MKVILTMAISANGFIATTTGSEEFLSHDNWLQFVKLAKKVGCFMWGRKTYEAVSNWNGDYLDDLREVKKIVISSNPNLKLKDGFTLASTPEIALKILSEEGFEEAIITGGATTNSFFAKNNLIDEVILDVNPSLIGDGVPVFASNDFGLKLDLINFEKIGENIVELKYKVTK